MVRIPCHRVLAAVVLLGYLLCGNGLARAFVWCVDEAGHSHVELNPAGDCQVACPSDPDPPFRFAPGWNSAPAGEECRDISLLASQAKNIRIFKPVAFPCAPVPFDMPPTLRQLAGAAPYSLHPRCLQPPPSSTLAALKTVVLLN